MKIRQAVVTSAVVTLDGRQGLGLVLCSRSLPQEIRQMAKEFEHSSSSNRSAICCLRIPEISGDRWVVMNRAVPDIDYTGRTSHVSHTVAFREEELKKFFQSRNSAIPSAFEFMRNFEWRSSWKDEPKWLEDDADLDEFQTKAFNANLFDESKPLDPKYLLAFDYSETVIPMAKRLAWRFNERNSEDILDIFHQAWLCLDPWQGTRKYEDRLDEPEVSMFASWQCTFSTNLLHVRPDPYVWVVLPPECPEIQLRELIEPSNLHPQTPDAIKEKIAHPLGDLLVDRCIQGPKFWAEKQIQKKIADFAHRYRERLADVAVTEKDEITELIKSLRTEIKNCENWVKDYIKKEHGETAKENIENHLSDIRAKMGKCETDAQSKLTELTKSFLGEVTPLKTLLNTNKESNDIDVESTEKMSIFKELHIDFNEASEKYSQAYHQYYFLAIADQHASKKQELERKVGELNSKQATRAKKISDLESEISIKGDSIKSLQKLIDDLRTKIPNPKKRKQMGWKMYSWILVSVLALGLIAIIFLNLEKIHGSKPTPTEKVTSKELKSEVREGEGREGEGSKAPSK